MSLKNVISENTGVSLGLVVILIGAVVWLTNISATANNSKGDIEALKVSNIKSQDTVQEVRDRVVRIESKLDQLMKR